MPIGNVNGWLVEDLLLRRHFSGHKTSTRRPRSNFPTDGKSKPRRKTVRERAPQLRSAGCATRLIERKAMQSPHGLTKAKVYLSRPLTTSDHRRQSVEAERIHERLYEARIIVWVARVIISRRLAVGMRTLTRARYVLGTSAANRRFFGFLWHAVAWHVWRRRFR
jgi:hypothetical protein